MQDLVLKFMAEEPAELDNIDWFSVTQLNFVYNQRLLYKYRNNQSILNKYCQLDIDMFNFNRYYLGSFVIDDNKYIDTDFDTGISIWPTELINYLFKLFANVFGDITSLKNIVESFNPSNTILFNGSINDKQFPVNVYSNRGGINLDTLSGLLSRNLVIAIPCRLYNSMNLCLFSKDSIRLSILDVLRHFCKKEEIICYVYEDPNDFLFFEKTKVDKWNHLKPDSITKL